MTGWSQPTEPTWKAIGDSAMKTALDCIPCFVRQALEAARFATSDESIQTDILREVLRKASDMDMQDRPPQMAQRFHRAIRQATGDADPYRKVKDRFNWLALAHYPALRKRVETSEKPREMALRLAIAGNIIDFAVDGAMNETKLRNAVAHAMGAPLDEETVERFFHTMDHAQRILYLGDNAGEVVFDRLLIEQLPRERITFAVRGQPIINDATRIDAHTAGIANLVTVIDNGSDAPGTLLEECSDEFRTCFDKADIIISKGQGNYETLSESRRPIFFLFKAKCAAIATQLGCEVGDLMIRFSNETLIGMTACDAAEPQDKKYE